MQSKQLQEQKWRTEFYIAEDAPYSGELYTIKLCMALLSLDGRLENANRLSLDHDIQLINQSGDNFAITMLYRIMDFALSCAKINRYSDAIDKINSYQDSPEHENFCACKL